MSTNYSVEVESFAERHFIKNLKKKYKNAWEVTWRAVVEEFKRIDSLIKETKIAETIVDLAEVKIVKTQFRVVGTNESRKSSGNRCIVAVYKTTSTIHVLLVYHKNDLNSANETACWKQLVKESYPQYARLL